MNSCCTKKYIIAVIGYANDGKTHAINKFTQKLVQGGLISGITPWRNGQIPLYDDRKRDFMITGDTTKYGHTGIISDGDQIGYLRDYLLQFANNNCNVIVCACRKESPKTFSAVAEVS